MKPLKIDHIVALQSGDVPLLKVQMQSTHIEYKLRCSKKAKPWKEKDTAGASIINSRNTDIACTESKWIKIFICVCRFKERDNLIRKSFLICTSRILKCSQTVDPDQHRTLTSVLSRYWGMEYSVFSLQNHGCKKIWVHGL